MGVEPRRGGSLGGNDGLGFVMGPLADAGDCSISPRRRTGGLGRLVVARPLVSTLYGLGGGAGFLAASTAARVSLRSASSVA